MPDSESDSECSPAPASSEAAVTELLPELARISPVPGVLREVLLPTPLRGLVALPAQADEVPAPGSVVDGRYRLDAVLGSGGMGVVFSAQHVHTGKTVALKWLSLSRAQRGSRDRAQALARFAREARAAGRIHHPNVVDVYDASGDERAPYLVMERLEGETLRARIERSPLSWEELIRVLVPAMSGVAELHRQGIVHRDLKPDNVFLAREPGSGATCAKVLDFGVSLLRARDAHEDSLTGTGAVVGTPSYMPLEQLRGADEVDERTDVYALGVVLFEALTGRRPWQARSAAEYGALLASARPTRLSSLRPELKGAREAAIMKALEREPRDRHASVDAFSAALLTAGQARPVSARIVLVCALLILLLAVFLLRQREDAAVAGQAVTARPVAASRQAPTVTVAAPRAVEVPAPASSEATLPVADEAPPSPPARTPRPRPAPAQLSAQGKLDALSAREPPVQTVSPPTDPATSLARDEF